VLSYKQLLYIYIYKLDCSLNFIAENWIKTGDQKIQRVPEVIFCFLKKN